MNLALPAPAVVPGGNLRFHSNVSKTYLRSFGMEWLIVTAGLSRLLSVQPPAVAPLPDTVGREIVAARTPGG